MTCLMMCEKNVKIASKMADWQPFWILEIYIFVSKQIIFAHELYITAGFLLTMVPFQDLTPGYRSLGHSSNLLTTPSTDKI